MENFSLPFKVDFVTVGPGLSLSPSSQSLTLWVLETARTPVLVDGDGITAVANAQRERVQEIVKLREED